MQLVHGEKLLKFIYFILHERSILEATLSSGLNYMGNCAKSLTCVLSVYFILHDFGFRTLGQTFSPLVLCLLTSIPYWHVSL